MRFGVEGGASETDENENHAEVDDVAAITAGVAHGEFVGRHHFAHAGAGTDDFRAAVKLHDDGPGDEAAESETERGGGITIAEDERGDSRESANHERPTEIALQAVAGSLAPGEQRSDAGEEKNGKADGDHHFVEEGSTHADAIAGEPFGEDREECAGKNGDAGNEEKQIVEQEAGFAETMGIKRIFALEVILILESTQ